MRLALWGLAAFAFITAFFIDSIKTKTLLGAPAALNFLLFQATVSLKQFHRYKRRARTPCLEVASFLWSKEPATKEEINTRFYLMTRDHPERMQIAIGKYREFGESEWGSLSEVFENKKTVFITHGFQSTSEEVWVDDMAKSLLEKDNVKVIAVDWRNGAKPRLFNYAKAVSNTHVVGEVLAELVIWLHKEMGLSYKDVHLIGHSLGAQISSFVSQHLEGQKIGRLTALDPASPCFSMASEDMRIDESDADFVDAIHTNGKSSFGLGLMKAVGNVDFYPNGGKDQPVCSLPSRLSRFARKFKIFRVVETAICSHATAAQYFTESITAENKCKFWGRSWNVGDNSTECHGQGCQRIAMGYDCDNYDSRGTFYVPVSKNTPHCSFH